MALSWWEQCLWHICMHHYTVHAKVEFNKFPPDVKSRGVHSTTFDPELRNERFTLISLMGFPAILSTLQPFQICICNRKNRKFTFSNGPQLMGIRFMANLHASLDSTCKSRISNISTRCQIQGGHSTAFDPEIRNEFKIFPILQGTKPTCNTHLMSVKSELKWWCGLMWPYIPHGSIPPLFIQNSEMNLKICPILGGPFHNVWSWPKNEFKIFFLKPTCNTHLTPMKYETEIIVWSNVNVLYTIPWVHFQLFILNSEMKDLHWYLLWGFLQY